MKSSLRHKDRRNRKHKIMVPSISQESNKRRNKKNSRCIFASPWGDMLCFRIDLVLVLMSLVLARLATLRTQFNSFAKNIGLPCDLYEQTAHFLDIQTVENRLSWTCRKTTLTAQYVYPGRNASPWQCEISLVRSTVYLVHRICWIFGINTEVCNPFPVRHFPLTSNITCH